jgi:hypothetical protein
MIGSSKDAKKAIMNAATMLCIKRGKTAAMKARIGPAPSILAAGSNVSSDWRGDAPTSSTTKGESFGRVGQHGAMASIFATSNGAGSAA